MQFHCLLNELLFYNLFCFNVPSRYLCTIEKFRTYMQRGRSPDIQAVEAKQPYFNAQIDNSVHINIDTDNKKQD